MLESKSIKLQNRVADIVKELEFQADGQAELLAAIEHYQQKRGAMTQSELVDYLQEARAQKRRFLVRQEEGTVRIRSTALT